MRTTKICRGPAHDGEAVPLPLTEEYWYFRQSGPRKGEARSSCKLCYSLRGQKGGWVECRFVVQYVKELDHRTGSLERAAEYAGVATSTFYRIVRGGQCSITRETATKIIRALDEKRREDRRNGKVHDKFLQVMREQARIEAHLKNQYN